MGILRQRSWKLTIFMCFITITLPLSMAMTSLPVYAYGAVIALNPPSILDETLTPGSTFSINVTIANVQNLWGYQYALFYNASVITAINYEKLDDRFTLDLPSEIGADFVWISRGTFYGDVDGVTTVDPIPVDRIEFLVTGEGTTILAFDSDFTELADVQGTILRPLLVDGFFANIAPAGHDIAITHVTASPTRVARGETVGIDVAVLNKGNETETFDVTVKYDDTEIETKTVTDLASLASATLSFSWDTTGVSVGEYVITAVASVVEGEVNTADNTYVDDTVTINPAPPVASFTWQPEMPYVGENVTFDASASYDPDGTIVKYIWYFDGYTPTVIEENDPIATYVFTVVGTHWVYLQVVDDDGSSGHVSASVKVLSGPLIELSGELDYLWKERVKVRLSALVRNAETMEPVSDANVTVAIYDPEGNLWVSDVMVERLAGTGIYEWESSDTILALRLEKGVYLVHAQASIRESRVASDILEFHIDPPGEGSSGVPIYYLITVSTVLVGVIGLILLRETLYNAFRQAVQ